MSRNERNERDEVSLATATQLLQEMHGDGAISSEQVTRFRHNPGGPIIPETCVSVVRHESVFGHLEGDLVNLASDSTGRPWAATVNMENGRRIIRLHCGREIFQTISIPEAEHWYVDPNILGFHADGRPITEVIFDAFSSMDEGCQPPPRFFVGEDPLPHGENLHTDTVSIQRDGSVIYTIETHELTLPPLSVDRKFRVMNLGSDGKTTEILQTTGHQFRRFAAGPEGKTLALYRVSEDSGGWRDAGCQIHHGKVMRTDQFSWKQPVGSVLWESEAALWVIETNGEIMRCVWVGGNSEEEGRLCRGEGVKGWMSLNRFRRNFVCLDDGRFAYIGETRRHHRLCWVVDGEEQPGFYNDFRDGGGPTSLFKQDGRWRYYAMTKSHLVLMELPEPKKVAP